MSRAPSDEILQALPSVYAALLALRAVGRSDEEIAAELGLPIESVPTTASLAKRKLERLLDGPAA